MLAVISEALTNSNAVRLFQSIIPPTRKQILHRYKRRNNRQIDLLQMKTKSKEHLKSLLISGQINNRRNKTAKGMTFTNERRAAQTGNSFLYARLVNERLYQSSAEARTLAVYGTLDPLARLNTKIKLSLKRWFKKKRGSL